MSGKPTRPPEMKTKIVRDEHFDLNKLLEGGPVVFSQAEEEEEVFHQDDLIQLKPFGISLTADAKRPFLLLKDSKAEHTLPVAMHPLEAGLSINQSQGTYTVSSPFRMVEELAKSLDIQFLQCVFVQIKGPVQYVRVYMKGHPSLASLKVRADEAMAACLHFAIPIYATKSFINKSKVLNVQIEGMNNQMLKNHKLLTKNHPHLM